MMFVALSGTPGTGKTRLLREFLELVEPRDIELVTVELNSFIKDEGLVLGEDTRRGSLEVDMAALKDVFRERFFPPPPSPKESAGEPRLLLVEGHLSHELVPDICIALRCSPAVLRQRLEGRNYPLEKVQENLEAEALNIIRDDYLQQMDVFGEYYQNVLSVFRTRNLPDPENRYLEHPIFPFNPDDGPAASPSCPLLELDSSDSGPWELVTLLTAVLNRYFWTFEKIKKLKARKVPGFSSPGDNKSSGFPWSPLVPGETLLGRIKDSFSSSWLHVGEETSSCEPLLDDFLARNYRSGIIDWSSEILTWY